MYKVNKNHSEMTYINTFCYQAQYICNTSITQTNFFLNVGKSALDLRFELTQRGIKTL